MDFDRIVGKKIILRKAKLSDTESMLNEVWGDEEVYRWMLFTPTLNMSDAIDRTKRSIEYQKEHYAYFIADKETDKAIGLCAIRELEPHIFEECGICISRKYQGEGRGKEVVKLLLDLAFNDLGGEEFRYGFFDDNIKSKKVAEYFHFKYHHEEDFIRPWDQAKKHIIICSLSIEEYRKNI